MSLLVNFALYQIGWFAIVIGAASGHPGWGTLTAIVLVAAHLALARGMRRHLALIVCSGAIGLGVDSLQLALGVFRFPGGQLVEWLAPPWDVVLWMQFATILPFCLRWLSRRYLLSAVLGAVGGPLAFYTGEQFGAVSFLPPRLTHFAVLGAFWALALPALVWLADRLVTRMGLGTSYWLFTSMAGERAASVNDRELAG